MASPSHDDTVTTVTWEGGLEPTIPTPWTTLDHAKGAERGEQGARMRNSTDSSFHHWRSGHYIDFDILGHTHRYFYGNQTAMFLK